MTTPVTYDPMTWAGWGEFTVSIARSPEEKAAAAGWLEAEHFLGSFKPVGHSLLHIIREDGEPAAVIQWAACAYHLKDREAWPPYEAILEPHVGEAWQGVGKWMLRTCLLPKLNAAEFNSLELALEAVRPESRPLFQSIRARCA